MMFRIGGWTGFVFIVVIVIVIVLIIAVAFGARPVGSGPARAGGRLGRPGRLDLEAALADDRPCDSSLLPEK